MNGALSEPIVDESEFLAIFSTVNVAVVEISDVPSKEFPKILTGVFNAVALAAKSAVAECNASAAVTPVRVAFPSESLVIFAPEPLIAVPVSLLNKAISFTAVRTVPFL